MNLKVKRDSHETLYYIESFFVFFFLFLFAVHNIMEFKPRSNYVYCEIPDHYALLIQQFQVIFRSACGNCNYWYKRLTALPTDENKIVLLNSSLFREEQQPGTVSQTVKHTFLFPALSGPTAVITVFIIKAEHYQAIIQSFIYRNFGKAAFSANKQKHAVLEIYRPDTGLPIIQYVQSNSSAKGNRSQRSKSFGNI